jgi:hypothetical protein
LRKEVCLCQRHLSLERSRVYLRDELPLLHRRIEININVFDRPGDLGADKDRCHCIHGACRGDRRYNISPGDFFGPVFQIVLTCSEYKNAAALKRITTANEIRIFHAFPLDQDSFYSTFYLLRENLYRYFFSTRHRKPQEKTMKLTFGC